MENFDWTQFTKRIAIKAPMQTLYNAWAQTGELEKWFLKTAQYLDANGANIERNASAQSGMRYVWNWYLYEETEYGQVLIANDKDHFQFTFAGQCKVDITLSEEFGYTIVQLIQSNIPTDDKSRQDIFMGCSAGWAFYLINMKSIYEGGLDLRSKDERLKPMVNN
jgi:uncharacterized protein YndB with AHSA1/START domain